MDFLELTSSQELLLFEAVCNVSSDVPIVQSEPTRTVVVALGCIFLYFQSFEIER
jgi:hypothetical protein